MILRVLVGIALMLGPTSAGGQTPTPIAERIATQFGRTTRVSLFSNHVVVVTIRSESEDYVHRTTLEYDEYMVYLRSLTQAAADIGDQPVSSDVESRDARSTLVIHVGADAPRVFRYSPLSSLDLAVGRISSIMDDLQARALASLPGEYELRHWSPRVGDCVELRQGGEACVIAIGEDDGVITLRRRDIEMTYSVAKEDRAELILKVIEPPP